MERPEEQRSSGRLRCPFCHDQLPDGHDRVSCAGCGAGHHAACVLEGQGCASCAAREVVVGETSVGLLELAAALEDAATLARLARRRSPSKVARLALAGLGAVAALALTLLAATGVVPPLAAGLLVLLFTATLHALLAAPRRRNPRDAQGEAASLASAGLAPQDPTGGFLAGLRASTPPPRPAGRPPTTCPQCARCLVPEDEDPAWFCHHCGASLLPEGGDAKA